MTNGHTRHMFVTCEKGVDREKIGALLSDADQLPGNGRLDSSSIGIRNVHRRLRLLYGKESGLTIRDSGDGKTVSELIICRQ